MGASLTIGIIGGSGLYEIEGLSQLKTQSVSTPFGKPSDRLVSGLLEGVRFVFLPRHGRGHLYNPSEVNYRANIFALKKLGVQGIVAMSAVGSLKEEIPPGDVVIVDQFIDRTKGIRPSTFFEKGGVAHVSFGDPVCKALSQVALKAATSVTPKVHPQGTYVCMEGPQFSTRAESNLYRSWGADIIGMTNIPEAKLAREAELCYVSIAFSTDYDCWREGEEEVSAEKVLAVIKKNVNTGKSIIKALPPLLKSKELCFCHEALKHAIVTDRKKIPKAFKQRLKLILGRTL